MVPAIRMKKNFVNRIANCEFRRKFFHFIVFSSCIVRITNSELIFSISRLAMLSTIVFTSLSGNGGLQCFWFHANNKVKASAGGIPLLSRLPALLVSSSFRCPSGMSRCQSSGSSLPVLVVWISSRSQSGGSANSSSFGLITH